MLDLTWKLFCMTGNIDTYLLMKELENDEEYQDERRLTIIPEAELDSTVH